MKKTKKTAAKKTAANKPAANKPAANKPAAKAAAKKTAAKKTAANKPAAKKTTTKKTTTNKTAAKKTAANTTTKKTTTNKTAAKKTTTNKPAVKKTAKKTAAKGAITTSKEPVATGRATAEEPTTTGETTRQASELAAGAPRSGGPDRRPSERAENDRPGDQSSGRQAKALMDAASQGELAEIEKLLAKGVDPKVLYQDSSALAWAAYKGHVEIVKRLLEAGADPNVGKSYPSAGNAMHAAASHGSVEILEILGAAGGDASSVGQKPDVLPLFCAAKHGHGAAVAWLLDRGAEPHVVANNQSAMVAAAMGGSLEVLDLLYARGASLSSGRRCPLHQAIRSGRSAAVKWFLAHGIDANALEYGEGSATALHVAAEKDETGPEIIDILVAAGANLEARCDNAAGRAEHPTPLQVAISNARPAAVECLLKHGADPAAATGDDEVPDARAMAKQKVDNYGEEDPDAGYMKVYRLLWP